MLRVLIIEEDETIAEQLRGMLGPQSRAGPLDEKVDLTIVDSLGAGLNRLRLGAPDLLMVDLVLRDSHPADTFVRIRATGAELPVIVLTAPDDDHWPAQAIANGAQDYLVRTECDATLLRRSIRYATERFRLLTEVRKSQIRDAVTGIFNRVGFYLHADQQMKAAHRSQGIWLIVARLDGLGALADQRPAQAQKERERMLAVAARLLRGAVRESDLLARISDDEFGLMLLDIPRDSLERVTARLDLHVKEHNARSGKGTGAIAFTIGKARLEPKSAYTLDQLLAMAGDALFINNPDLLWRIGTPAGGTPVQR